MSDDASVGLVEQARGAAALGEWKAAFDLLMEADAAGMLMPPDLPTLAEVAYAAGHLDVTIEAWERAHAACMQAGLDVEAAGAAVRVAMHLLFDTALMAPVRGWLARAERLLQGHSDTPAHAWYAVVRAYERMLSGDTTTARESARQAVDIGSKHDAAACAIGRVAEARLLILDGEVEEGVALLNEAGVATMSGELDALSTGVVFCELVCALQGLAQYDMAEQWTEAMEHWCESNAIGSLHGRCRVHRAEILRLRGSYDEAETHALMACEELRPYLRRELGWPLSELGRIRLQRGDLGGAEEALLAAQHAGWSSQPGLALVRLAQGDAAGAASAIRGALESPVGIPSKERPPNTDLQRAPLLDAQVHIAVAVGDRPRADAAAGELDAIATRFGSKALLAAAAVARGRVRLAAGEPLAAQQALSDGVRLWNEVGAPYEVAAARAVLVSAQDASAGDTSDATQPRAVRMVASGNVCRREGDVWLLRFDGDSVRVRERKGMHYLARLLGDPGREFHALDLVAAEAGEPAAAGGDAGEMLDSRAKEAYRRRLAEIDDDLDQAAAAGDAVRAAQAEAERAFLIRELSRAVGLGGRDRRAASAPERARVSVTRALRQAITGVAEHHTALGEHLQRAIRTGTYCAYMPDRTPADWAS
jgi:tetratricopeptide (TPR) repeat protein